MKKYKIALAFLFIFYSLGKSDPNEIELINLFGGGAYSEGENLEDWINTPYSIESVQDGVFETGINILGEESIKIWSSRSLDYGGFALLEFQADSSTFEKLYIDIHVRSYGYGNFVCMSGRLSGHTEYQKDQTGIQHIFGYYDSTGNNFYGGDNSVTLEMIQRSGNRFSFLIWGPMWCGVPKSGMQGLEILEAHAYTEEPEPIPFCTEYPDMDFDHNCKVDFLDFVEFISQWMTCNLEPESACWE